MLRRTFLTGSAGLLAASLLPGLAHTADLTPLIVQLNWIANVEFGDHWIAKEKGLFEAGGLDVTVDPGGPNSPSPLTMVSAGSAHIGYTNWLSFLDAVAKGNDFVLIGARFQQSPLGIISMAKNPILKAEDIIGKKILLQGAAEKTAIDATLSLAKIKGDWTGVPAGYSPEPLVAGEGDGYTALGTNQTIIMEKMGLVRDKDFYFRSFNELGFAGYAGLAFVDRKFLDANRPALVNYLAALMKALKINRENPELAPELAVTKYGKDYGLNLDQQIRQNELQQDFMWPGGEADFPLFDLDMDKMSGAMMEAAKATGRTDLPPVEQFADPSLLKDAREMM